jgi:hypothetical protein
VQLIADGALSWGAGAARGAQRVRVEYEDRAMQQLGATPRQRRPRMRLIQSGLDLFAGEIRAGRMVEAGLRLEGDTVQVLELVDDTVVVPIRANAGSYLAVHGQRREDWHAFATAQVAPLTEEQARQHGVALA